MKIFKFKYSFNNDEAMFSIANNFKIENSKFTKDEICLLYTSPSPRD